MEIGSLRGTLLNQLIVTDVALRGDDGTLVATADSIHTQPRWYDLLTYDLSVYSLTIVRPHLRLHRAADETWNLERVLQPQSSSQPRQLDLEFSRVSVREGRITTTRSGSAPSAVNDRWLFDYTQADLEDLTADVAFEWGSSNRRIDLLTLSARLPDQNLTLKSVQGQLTNTDSRWSVQDAALRLGDTRLGIEGNIQPAPTDSSRTVVDFQISDGQLDNDELRRLIPRLPLRSKVAVEGRIGGSLDRLVVNELTAAHGQSSVRVEGTAYGLPDSLNVEADLRESRIAPSDLQTVWPAAPVSIPSSTGPLQVAATVKGLVQWQDRPQPALNLSGAVRAQGRPGAVRGTLEVARPSSEHLRYTASLQADSLNLAPVMDRPELKSRLNGRATLQGEGTTFDAMESSVSVRLSNSRFASRTVSSAVLRASIDDKIGKARVSLRQQEGGRLTARGTLDATSSMPRFEGTSSTQEFDLAEIHSSLPSTDLNATLTTRGQGSSWRTLTGRAFLNVNPSTLYRADSTISLPSHDLSLVVDAPAPDSSRISVGGTIASATVEGSRVGPALWSSARLWARSLGQALSRQFPPQSSPAEDSTDQPERSPSLRARAGTTLTQQFDRRPLQLRGEATLHHAELLQKWWPDAPAAAENLRAQSRITLSPDTLSAQGTLSAHHLHMRGRRIEGLDADFRLAGALQPDLLDHMKTEVSIQADTVQVGDRDLTAPSVALSLAQGEGTLQARAIGFGRTGPFNWDSDVVLGAGQTDVILRDLYVGVGERAWTTQSASTLSIHSDALFFDSLDVESQRPKTDGMQKLRLHGTLSSASSDTLYVDASDALLYPLAQLVNLSRPLGGRLNGQVAVAGGLGQPKVRGSFEIQRLSFDRRVLGTLSVESQLTPDSPDLLLDAALEPNAQSADSLAGPALVPGGIRTLEENRLTVKGRVRLPGWSVSEASPGSPSDQLDLSVNVDRADLFFFKYIFDDNLAQARGYTAGSIHVGGRFRRPVFDAELRVRDARFTLPKFGLGFRASGPVKVDREGIHTQGLRVNDGAGSALIEGSVFFNDYNYFSFDLSSELNEFNIIDVAESEDLPFYGDIRASGSASLTGPLSDATLRSERARTTPDSELYIPVSEGEVEKNSGYIIFADSTGQVPNLRDLVQRDNILSDRPVGEPSFLDGLDIDLNVTAPEESTVHLVFDPVLGDVVTAVGSGRVQLQRQGGDFSVYGSFNVSGGTYLFTAGDVFVRRFNISGGTITWDGPPTNAQLAIDAEYGTRASTAGLPGYDQNRRIPIRVLLNIGGRVETPEVELNLAQVRDERSTFLGTKTLDAALNRPDQRTEYATSVLLTNTFLLTTESLAQEGSAGTGNTSPDAGLGTAGNQLAFNSVSQLVASQLNRYLGAALPNVDLNFGLQGEDPNDLDVIYGIALRLLNERLIIRGEGVYTGEDPDQAQAQGPQGEFVVELRLSNRISVEAFYRRQGDEFTLSQTLTSSTGAGLSYQTEFSSWWELFDRIFGWLWSDSDDSDQKNESSSPPVAEGTRESTPSTSTNEDENPNN
ncbi:MAG: translocation/assembly module TamB [Bacteroidetes bacterium QH_7_62_13]|nr:MAG: translocation/assembly module TamB [Bacteroidetes bacterium QH_7_62_13]